MTHSQWTHRNHILHACDAQCIQLQKTQELESHIQQQFHLGSHGLLTQDFHLIECGLDSILSMATPGKLSWLSSIHVAWENFAAYVLATEVEGIRITNYFHPA
jgi:aryl carrier-like protein